MDENFEVVFHGGRFVNDGSLKYIRESSILSCDPDRWSYFEIMSILREMGYVNVKELWYSIGRGACHMVNMATLNEVWLRWKLL